MVAMSNSLYNPASFCLSLAVVPVLFGLMAAHSLAENLRELGENSEELFRGERLPLLNLPEPKIAEES